MKKKLILEEVIMNPPTEKKAKKKIDQNLHKLVTQNLWLVLTTIQSPKREFNNFKQNKVFSLLNSPTEVTTSFLQKLKFLQKYTLHLTQGLLCSF